MKRRVFQVVLLLLAGAIVNVAVAWGCSMAPHVGFTLGQARVLTLPSSDVIGIPCFVIEQEVGLPLRSFGSPKFVLWPGFAINTVFYATILWMMCVFPFVIRRKRRIKRGLCPACAYPVGTSEVCTECGGPVNTQKTETQKAEM